MGKLKINCSTAQRFTVLTIPNIFVKIIFFPQQLLSKNGGKVNILEDTRRRSFKMTLFNLLFLHRVRDYNSEITLRIELEIAWMHYIYTNTCI